MNVLFGEAGDDFLDGRRPQFDLASGGFGTDTCENWENDPGNYPTECRAAGDCLGPSQRGSCARTFAAIARLDRAERLLGGAR